LSEEPKSSAPSAVTPEVRRAQRWNIVWVVPIVALLLGAWLLYRNFAAQGPLASVGFETATGIYAGKTEVRCRSVRVGVVKDVKLAEDLKSVAFTSNSRRTPRACCAAARFSGWSNRGSPPPSFPVRKP
jgi:paraquat-inducible protein B